MTSIPLDRTRTCKACGKRVMFVTTNDKRVIPLDVAAPIYTRVHDPETGKGFWVEDETAESLVAHSAVCSRKNQFSGAGRGRRG